MKLVPYGPYGPIRIGDTVRVSYNDSFAGCLFWPPFREYVITDAATVRAINRFMRRCRWWWDR